MVWLERTVSIYFDVVGYLCTRDWGYQSLVRHATKTVDTPSSAADPALHGEPAVAVTTESDRLCFSFDSEDGIRLLDSEVDSAPSRDRTFGALTRLDI